MSKEQVRIRKKTDFFLIANVNKVAAIRFRLITKEIIKNSFNLMRKKLKIKPPKTDPRISNK